MENHHWNEESIVTGGLWMSLQHTTYGISKVYYNLCTTRTTVCSAALRRNAMRHCPFRALLFSILNFFSPLPLSTSHDPCVIGERSLLFGNVSAHVYMARSTSSLLFTGRHEWMAVALNDCRYWLLFDLGVRTHTRTVRGCRAWKREKKGLICICVYIQPIISTHIPLSCCATLRVGVRYIYIFFFSKRKFTI